MNAFAYYHTLIHPFTCTHTSKLSLTLTHPHAYTQTYTHTRKHTRIHICSCRRLSWAEMVRFLDALCLSSFAKCVAVHFIQSLPSLFSSKYSPYVALLSISCVPSHTHSNKLLHVMRERLLSLCLRLPNVVSMIILIRYIFAYLLFSCIFS